MQHNFSKTFIIDTNVLLSDAHAIFAFSKCMTIIPMIVLEELDRKKDRMDDVGANARQVCRHLDELRTRGSLREGIMLDNGGCLKVLSVDDVQGTVPDEFNDSLPDNMIIGLAVSLSECESYGTVTVVTKDINMRIKCNVLDIICEDYLKYHVANDISEIYSGYSHIDIPDDVVHELNNNRNAMLPANIETFPNQFLIDTKKNIIIRCDPYNRSRVWRFNQNDTDLNAWGMRGRNLEQQMALKLLFYEDIKLVTLMGPAGGGKTMLAVAAALEQVIETSRYNKLIISRPVQPVGRDIGFLPGTKEEKLHPWLQPIYDNIEQLCRTQRKNDSMFEMWMQKGFIEIEAITYMRGRSLANAFIIIDEAQNLTAHEMKTIITRVGENTKIVLTGDIEQVDNTMLDSLSNGLTYAVEKFKNHSIAGHVTLKTGERSALATLASQIL